MRNFLITTLGVKKNSASLEIDNFDLKSDKFPSHIKCLDHSKKLHPNLEQITLLSITEMNDDDFKEFISKT